MRIPGASAVALALAACTLGGQAGGGLQTTGGMMEADMRPRPRRAPTPDPLLGIALSDSQRVRVDSIRAMYWLQVEDMGGPEPATYDEFDNLVRREQVDVRLVLTPEPQTIYDRHLAENRKRAREPVDD
ncbi:MAG TPA: hypothetical protein VFA43_03215 [Gemmatimonadaceae bacterium]|nr:hypothetical protein [Gemmatimonadaceae bacterium]